MTEVIETSESGGKKGRKPETYSLIPTGPLAHLARVYGYGAGKYGKNNYVKSFPYSWSLDALMRHLEAFRSGENLDPESGHPHLAHVAWHAFTLMFFAEKGIGTDDREK
jgi:hypothetical protein